MMYRKVYVASLFSPSSPSLTQVDSTKWIPLELQVYINPARISFSYKNWCLCQEAARAGLPYRQQTRWEGHNPCWHSPVPLFPSRAKVLAARVQIDSLGVDHQTNGSNPGSLDNESVSAGNRAGHRFAYSTAQSRTRGWGVHGTPGRGAHDERGHGSKGTWEHSVLAVCSRVSLSKTCKNYDTG